MVTVGTHVLNPLGELQEYLGCQEVTGIPEELNIKKRNIMSVLKDTMWLMSDLGGYDSPSFHISTVKFKALESKVRLKFDCSFVNHSQTFFSLQLPLKTAIPSSL